MLKLKMMPAWCCRWSSSVAHQRSLAVKKKVITRCGIMQPPPDWQTLLNGIISPSERGWSLCKNNWKEPRSILMSSADRVAHIDGQLMQLLWAIIITASAEYKCLKQKTEQLLYECLLGFCFNNIFCAATNFGCIDSFLRLIPETKKWWVMVSLWCYCRHLFWTVNVCWAHPVISRASVVASSIFFMVLFPMLFEVRRIVCVEN